MKYKIGDKVTPKNKTVYDFDTWEQWKCKGTGVTNFYHQNGFLYIQSKIDGMYTLGRKDVYGGDYFNEKDFERYEPNATLDLFLD